MKVIYLAIALLLQSLVTYSQQTDSILIAEQSKFQNNKVYKMKYGLDIPIAVAGTAWTLYSFTKIYGGDKTDEAIINALNPDDLNSIDRSTANNYSEKAKAASDKFFYGSMPAPLFLLLDKKIRKDAFLFGESQSRVIVSIDSDNQAEFEGFLKSDNADFTLLGAVIYGNCLVDNEHYGNTFELKQMYEATLPALMN